MKRIISICALLIISSLMVSCKTEDIKAQDSITDTVLGAGVDTRPNVVNTLSDTNSNTTPSPDISDFIDYEAPAIYGVSIDEIITQCPEDCEFMGGNISKDALRAVFAEYPFELLDGISYEMRELTPEIIEEYKKNNWDNEFGYFHVPMNYSGSFSEDFGIYMPYIAKTSSEELTKLGYISHESIPELKYRDRSFRYAVIINENLYFELDLSKEADLNTLQTFVQYSLSMRKIINQEGMQ